MDKNYFASIEFNRLYIAILITNFVNEKMHVVCYEKVGTNGFYKGEVRNKEDLIKSLGDLKKYILGKYKIDVDEVTLVLPNNNHKMYQASVSNKVLTERQIIGKKQIESIRLQIKNTNVKDEFVVTEEPTLYTIENGITLRTPPINRQSSMVAIQSNLHTIPEHIYLNIKEILDANNIKIIDQYLNVMCAAFATTDQFGLEEPLINVNIGVEVTTIGAFNKGVLIKSSSQLDFGILPLIIHLGKTLNVEFSQAKKYFESYFIANNDLASEVIIDEELNISQRRISAIILNYLYPFLKDIKEKVTSLANLLNYNNYHILLTGLLNNYEGIIDYFEKELDLSVLGGFNDNLECASEELTNLYGALLLYIKNNKDYVLEKIASDHSEEILVNTTSNNTSNTNKRFKDIFEDE